MFKAGAFNPILSYWGTILKCTFLLKSCHLAVSYNAIKKEDKSCTIFHKEHLKGNSWWAQCIWPLSFVIIRVGSGKHVSNHSLKGQPCFNTPGGWTHIDVAGSHFRQNVGKCSYHTHTHTHAGNAQQFNRSNHKSNDRVLFLWIYTATLTG